mmetsp:Transcript_18249/g.28987  ORF Transcript_18249/g.28987 Transcript_18249/m.28987 type:complete len:212 (+) Transcript_18249:1024-1659(+)
MKLTVSKTRTPLSWTNCAWPLVLMTRRLQQNLPPMPRQTQRSGRVMIAPRQIPRPSPPCRSGCLQLLIPLSAWVLSLMMNWQLKTPLFVTSVLLLRRSSRRCRNSYRPLNLPLLNLEDVGSRKSTRSGSWMVLPAMLSLAVPATRNLVIASSTSTLLTTSPPMPWMLATSTATRTPGFISRRRRPMTSTLPLTGTRTLRLLMSTGHSLWIR